MRASMSFTTVVAVALVLLCTVPSAAQFPSVMNYQVMLTDDLDEPLADQSVEVTFRLYELESGGVADWTRVRHPKTLELWMYLRWEAAKPGDLVYVTGTLGGSLETGHHRRRGVGDLVGLSCGEDEDDLGRRLFEHLQQGVPRLTCQHMGFVDDVDLVVPVLGRGVHGPFAQLPCVVHPAVRRGVDFDHVEIGGAVPDPGTDIALAAGFAGGGVTAPLAIERHGQDAGGGGLAHAAGSGEEIAVGHAVLLDCATEDGGHVFLYHQVGEALGSVAAGESDGHGVRRL